MARDHSIAVDLAVMPWPVPGGLGQRRAGPSRGSLGLSPVVVHLKAGIPGYLAVQEALEHPEAADLEARGVHPYGHEDLEPLAMAGRRADRGSGSARTDQRRRWTVAERSASLEAPVGLEDYCSRAEG